MLENSPRYLVPFDPKCPSSAQTVVDVDDVVPLGSAQQQVPHAQPGPIDELKVLSSG